MAGLAVLWPCFICCINTRVKGSVWDLRLCPAERTGTRVRVGLEGRFGKIGSVLAILVLLRWDFQVGTEGVKPGGVGGLWVVMVWCECLYGSQPDWSGDIEHDTANANETEHGNANENETKKEKKGQSGLQGQSLLTAVRLLGGLTAKTCRGGL